ncbi:MBL fold metallo-hydrolase [Methanococcoides orientis]|uniref:MBL fold metallo-hydrolase n=1 Tax=Methanococcoides orientis TaxID=2822137 RepID=UPI001E63B5B5|nr:MBL fold metallo-hydrolase [Methanococcoides orientis]UGV41698.1 MBL fold metallo-hydrolase [Methanococcoides orientis]
MDTSTNVIPIPLKMTTAFIVRGEGTILVDTGYPGSEDAILEKLHEIDIAPEDVNLIVLTHGHPDHAGSAAKLREITGAKVVINRLDANKLRTGTQGNLKPSRFIGRILKLFLGHGKNTRYPPLEPDILIEDLFELDEYGVLGKVISTPGHTPGSVSIILDNGDAIVGDLIVPSLLSSKPNIPFWADDLNEVMKSIQKLVDYAPERIYIAHFGGPYTLDDLKKSFRI